jgi:predicted membrane chloride channel (bestrophin family)
MFFEKWHKSNFSIVIEMVQSINIQYNMTKTSSNFSIIWIILKIYLHFAVYHDNI